MYGRIHSFQPCLGQLGVIDLGLIIIILTIIIILNLVVVIIFVSICVLSFVLVAIAAVIASAVVLAIDHPSLEFTVRSLAILCCSHTYIKQALVLNSVIVLS